ncbi:MAG: hypothetical protein K8H88_32645, partial [Sandaracinaceae bacterium]|nr:hypothetical protein [Sandaracinaceae bacterium]
RAYCNRGTTADEVRALAGQIRTEVEKDDRIESLAVTVTPAADGSSLSISLVVTPVAAELGGFTLTLAATSADVLLEEIR